MFFPTCLAVLGHICPDSTPPSSSAASASSAATTVLAESHAPVAGLSSSVRRCRVTHCDWSRGERSPEEFHQISEPLVAAALASGALFLRKVKCSEKSLVDSVAAGGGSASAPSSSGSSDLKTRCRLSLAQQWLLAFGKPADGSASHGAESSEASSAAVAAMSNLVNASLVFDNSSFVARLTAPAPISASDAPASVVESKRSHRTSKPAEDDEKAYSARVPGAVAADDAHDNIPAVASGKGDSSAKATEKKQAAPSTRDEQKPNDSQSKEGTPQSKPAAKGVAASPVPVPASKPSAPALAPAPAPAPDPAPVASSKSKGKTDKPKGDCQIS